MQNIKNSLLWVIELTNELTEALGDGKLQRSEVWALIPNAFKLPKVAAGIPFLAAEWDVLKNDEAQKNDVIRFVADKLDLDNDKAEQTVTASLKFGVAAGLYIQEMIKIYK